MSRPNLARRRAAAYVAVIGTAVAVAGGCAAGQIAETANIEPAVVGVNDNVGTMALRNVGLVYPEKGVYPRSANARLEFTLVNESTTPDRLVAISTDAATAVTVDGASSVDIDVPGNGTVRAYGTEAKVLLVDLQQQLRSTQNIEVTFRFERAGERTVTVAVEAPVTPIPQPPAKTPPPIHH